MRRQRKSRTDNDALGGHCALADKLEYQCVENGEPGAIAEGFRPPCPLRRTEDDLTAPSCRCDPFAYAVAALCDICSGRQPPSWDSWFAGCSKAPSLSLPLSLPNILELPQEILSDLRRLGSPKFQHSSQFPICTRSPKPTASSPSERSTITKLIDLILSPSFSASTSFSQPSLLCYSPNDHPASNASITSNDNRSHIHTTTAPKSRSTTPVHSLSASTIIHTEPTFRKSSCSPIVDGAAKAAPSSFTTCSSSVTSTPIESQSNASATETRSFGIHSFHDFPQIVRQSVSSSMTTPHSSLTRFPAASTLSCITPPWTTTSALSGENSKFNSIDGFSSNPAGPLHGAPSHTWTVEPTPDQSIQNSSSALRTHWVIAGSVIGVVLGGTIFIAAIMVFRYRRRKRHRAPSAMYSWMSGGYGASGRGDPSSDGDTPRGRRAPTPLGAETDALEVEHLMSGSLSPRFMSQTDLTTEKDTLVRESVVAERYKSTNVTAVSLPPSRLSIPESYYNPETEPCSPAAESSVLWHSPAETLDDQRTESNHSSSNSSTSPQSAGSHHKRRQSSLLAAAMSRPLESVPEQPSR